MTLHRHKMPQNQTSLLYTRLHRESLHKALQCKSPQDCLSKLRRVNSKIVHQISFLLPKWTLKQIIP